MEAKNVGSIFLEYSGQSTIAGIIYIFSSSQSRIGRIFWTLCTILLITLGIYWSNKGYKDWKASPVVTTPTSTAVSLQNVPFPTVTFCTKGFPSMVFVASFAKEMVDFMTDHMEMDFKNTPFEIALKNKHWLSSPIFQYVPFKDQELNILMNDISFNNSYVVDQLIKGYDFPPKNHILYAAIYTFNFFDQKQFDNFINATLLGLYLLFTDIPTSADRLKYFFNTSLQDKFKIFVAKWKSFFEDSIKRVHLNEAFESLFSHLWYSKLPCFDLRGITAQEDNDSSFIKNCLWKGIPISCSALFTKSPTDLGMCCTFNSAKADEMYLDSIFVKTMERLQNNDKNLSFSSTSLPDWYTKANEPKSKPGLTMGLQVTLDAHSDLLNAFSIDSPYDSFQAMVLPNGNFPLMSQSGIRIQRGCHNLISLSSTIISADDSLRKITPSDRGCLFSDEYPLKFFKNYSQSNCLFECLLGYAQKEVKDNLNLDRFCYPWNFPFLDQDQNTCDPRSSNYFDQVWSKSNGSCNQCLPDCNTFVYKQSLSYEPIRPCDDLNVGISSLCSFKDLSDSYKPFMWGEQVLSQIKSNQTKELLANGRNNKRSIFEVYSVGRDPFFENTKGVYDAYKRDIAIVSVFFKSPTSWMFTTSASSTWIVYISNVGGWLGLCIGVSFSTAVELLWLFIRFFIEGESVKQIKTLLQKFDRHEDKVIEEIDEVLQNEEESSNLKAVNPDIPSSVRSTWIRNLGLWILKSFTTTAKPILYIVSFFKEQNFVQKIKTFLQKFHCHKGEVTKEINQVLQNKEGNSNPKILPC